MVSVRDVAYAMSGMRIFRSLCFETNPKQFYKYSNLKFPHKRETRKINMAVSLRTKELGFMNKLIWVRTTQ